MIRWIWHGNVLTNQSEWKVDTWDNLECSMFSATELLPPLHVIKQCISNVGNAEFTSLGLRVGVILRCCFVQRKAQGLPYYHHAELVATVLAAGNDI
eukprot:11817965-Ditylum_brightwellii.AAC.1